MTDVYWHTRRKLWSIRVAGRVVAHRPTVRLVDVSFVVRPGAVSRIQVRRQREVCAWASGQIIRVRERDLPERGIARVIFDPYERAEFYHGISGRALAGCDLLMLEPSGEAWGWMCR